jgi:hypothetical protein
MPGIISNHTGHLRTLLRAGASPDDDAPAYAGVPSFAARTGQPCSACHIGGFGPQLTPLRRAFKIGYTETWGRECCLRSRFRRWS